MPQHPRQRERVGQLAHVPLSSPDGPRAARPIADETQNPTDQGCGGG
jgi:hypothetical protein